MHRVFQMGRGRLARHEVPTVQKETRDVSHNMSLPVMEGTRADMTDHEGLHSALQNFFQPCSFWILRVVAVRWRTAAAAWRSVPPRLGGWRLGHVSEL